MAISVITYLEKIAPYHLTLGTWRKLSVGQSLELAVFDRNLFDMIGEQTKPMLVTKFFKQTLKITKINETDLGGPAKWTWGDGESLDQVQVLEILSNEQEMWNPVDEQGVAFGKHWKLYPDNTHIGWRGHAIERKFLTALGPIKLYCPECCNLCFSYECKQLAEHTQQYQRQLQEAARVVQLTEQERERQRKAIEAAELEHLRERQAYGAARKAEAIARKLALKGASA